LARHNNGGYNRQRDEQSSNMPLIDSHSQSLQTSAVAPTFCAVEFPIRQSIKGEGCIERAGVRHGGSVAHPLALLCEPGMRRS
jgi:hypothetical protein